MVKHVVRFMREEEGATAVEYGLMVALIAGAIVVAVTLIGLGYLIPLLIVAGIVFLVVRLVRRRRAPADGT